MPGELKKFLLDGGDVLEVEWDGSAWIAPACGAQHGTATDAMEVELYHYLAACGDLPEEGVDPDLSEHGRWSDENA